MLKPLFVLLTLLAVSACSGSFTDSSTAVLNESFQTLHQYRSDYCNPTSTEVDKQAALAFLNTTYGFTGHADICVGYYSDEKQAG